MNAAIAVCDLLTRLHHVSMPPIRGLSGPFTSVLTRLSRHPHPELATAAATALQAMKKSDEMLQPIVPSTPASLSVSMSLNESVLSGLNMSLDLTQSTILERSVAVDDEAELTFFAQAEMSGTRCLRGEGL